MRFLDRFHAAADVCADANAAPDTAPDTAPDAAPNAAPNAAPDAAGADDDGVRAACVAGALRLRLATTLQLGQALHTALFEFRHLHRDRRNHRSLRLPTTSTPTLQPDEDPIPSTVRRRRQQRALTVKITQAATSLLAREGDGRSSTA